MQFGDTVWVVIDGVLREGELRGSYYRGDKDTDTWGVWMTREKAGQSKFEMFTFYRYEIFTDKKEAQKAEFKAALSGRYL